MTAAANELRQAIFTTLSEDLALMAALGTKRISDQPAVNVAFPYISFGRTSTYDWSTGTEKTTEQLFTLHIWSREKGNKEALEIMEMARWRLEDKSLPLDEHHVANLSLEFAEARHDDDLGGHHGLLRFRALIDEV